MSDVRLITGPRHALERDLAASVRAAQENAPLQPVHVRQPLQILVLQRAVDRRRYYLRGGGVGSNGERRVAASSAERNATCLG